MSEAVYLSVYIFCLYIVITSSTATADSTQNSLIRNLLSPFPAVPLVNISDVSIEVYNTKRL